MLWKKYVNHIFKIALRYFKDFSFAFVAQGIEHPPPKGRVARSNRAEGTILSEDLYILEKLKTESSLHKVFQVLVSGPPIHK